MDNPYWSSDGQTHHVNLEGIKFLCFDLLNISAASKPIAEEIEYAEVEDEKPVNLADFPLARLHRDYSFRHLSESLLQLALMVRTYDDQMKESAQRDDYINHLKNVDTGDYVGIIHGKEKFYLREACNKIIHAAKVRPLYERIDRMVCDAMEQGKIGQDIWYLTGEIELSGTFRGDAWEAVIHLQPFLETVLDVIDFGNPNNP